MRADDAIPSRDTVPMLIDVPGCLQGELVEGYEPPVVDLSESKLIHYPEAGLWLCYSKLCISPIQSYDVLILLKLQFQRLWLNSNIVGCRLRWFLLNHIAFSPDKLSESLWVLIPSFNHFEARAKVVLIRDSRDPPILSLLLHFDIEPLRWFGSYLFVRYFGLVVFDYVHRVSNEDFLSDICCCFGRGSGFVLVLKTRTELAFVNHLEVFGFGGRWCFGFRGRHGFHHHIVLGYLRLNCLNELLLGQIRFVHDHQVINYFPYERVFVKAKVFFRFRCLLLLARIQGKDIDCPQKLLCLHLILHIPGALILWITTLGELPLEPHILSPSLKTLYPSPLSLCPLHLFPLQILILAIRLVLHSLDHTLQVRNLFILLGYDLL